MPSIPQTSDTDKVHRNTCPEIHIFPRNLRNTFQTAPPVRPWRFNELKKDLDDISQKVITDSLRSMEADGIITRTVYPEVPPRVECASSSNPWRNGVSTNKKEMTAVISFLLPCRGPIAYSHQRQRHIIYNRAYPHFLISSPQYFLPFHTPSLQADQLPP